MSIRSNMVPPTWLVTGTSAMLLCMLFASHQAGALQIAIPACSMLIGLCLYVRNQEAYITFTLWAWFVTPLIRRLVDFRFGHTDQSIILLTPLVVTAIAGLALFDGAGSRRDLTPFYLCIGGVLYGFVIGVLRHAGGEVFYGLFNWLTPVLFGLNIYLQWPLYEQRMRAIQRTFLLGVFLMGGYGIYQYCNPPAWDVYWWQSLPEWTAASFGRPVKFQVRVWSTLNAPAPFAGVMGSGLLLSLAAHSRVKLVCISVGLAAFVLSLSRTEWVAFVVGLMFILYRGSRAFLVRTILGCVVLVVLCVPLLSIGTTQQLITQRLQSMGHLAEDESFQTRSAMYDRLTGDVLREPFGHGVSNAAVYDGYALDSGPLRFLLNLGVAGTAFYLIGLIQVLFRLLPKQASYDPVQAACGAVLLSALAKFISLSAFENAAGAIVWLCIGLGLAARRFHASPVETQVDEEQYSYAS